MFEHVYENVNMRASEGESTLNSSSQQNKQWTRYDKHTTQYIYIFDNTIKQC